MGIQRVVYETDCLDLIKEWKKESREYCTYLSALVKGCKSMLRNMAKVYFCHGPRSYNSATDQLARCIFQLLNKVWLGQVPLQVRNFVDQDKRVFLSLPLFMINRVGLLFLKKTNLEALY